MAKTPEEIAADLDELADAIEEEVADYRRTAASLRRRAGVQMTRAVRPKAKVEAGKPSPPGGSQAILLAAYREHGPQAITVDQLVDTAKSQGYSVSKQAAQAANNRMLKNGTIERVGHGQYRARQVTPASVHESPALNGVGAVHAEDGR